MNTSGTKVLTAAKELAWRHAGLLMLLVFVTAVATYHLTESPVTAFDEGVLTQLAMNLASRGALVIQTAPGVFTSGAYMSTGFPALAPIALAFKLFGTDILTARLSMVAFLLAFLTAAYVAGLRIYGKRPALFATALLATHASIFTYGKTVLGEIPGLFYLMLFFIGLERLSRPSAHPIRLVVLTSLALGLTAATKPVYLVILPVAALTLFIERKRLPVTPRTIAASAATLIITLGAWAATQFSLHDDFANIFLFYRNPGLYTNVASVILANANILVTASVPLFFLGSIILWTISITFRWREPRNRVLHNRVPAAETAAFLFSVLILIAWLRSPGVYRHFFPAQAVALIALPMVIEDLIRRFIGRFPSWNAANVARDLSFFLLLLLIAFHLFRLFSGSFITTSYTSTQTAKLRSYFDAFEPWRRPYIYDAPEIVPFLRTADYTQYIIPAGAAQFAVGIPPETARTNRADTIVMNRLRWEAERGSFAEYREITRDKRYVIIERNDLVY